ncbi:MAG: class I adenylate-forming enzyme family protein [Desulfomonilaceae bacterium]
MWKNPETIRELLAKNVDDFGQRDALVSVSYRTGNWIRHSWSDLNAISDRVANGLVQLGVKKGDKVACLLANHAESYYTYLAIHKIGAIFVPINIRLVPREVEFIVENAQADYLVSLFDTLKLVEKIRYHLKLKKCVCIHKSNHELPDWTISYEELIKSMANVSLPEIAPDDVADIIYTSGTTGVPKGVVLTEANKVACGRLFGTALGLSKVQYSPHRLQLAFPFFTSTGCSTVMMIWLYFAPTLILEESFDVLKALETMQKEKSTIYGGAPSMYAFILNHPRFKEFDTSSLRVVISGAAAMPEELIRKALAAWPKAKVYNTYALTEAGTGGTVLNAADAMIKIGSVGLPMPPDQEMRVVDSKGHDVKPKEVGEIILRGPNIMKEYYRNPKATAETLKDGWLHTGDMGYYDEEGYLYYTDRMKDMIVRGGFNIYSIEVENALYEHPAVKQCAVVAKPHERLGEDVVAFIVLKEGASATTEELHDFTKDKLADYKRPRDIRFIDALPINPTGKVDKKVLRSSNT